MAKARSKALRSLDEFAQAGVQCFLRGGYRLTQVADVSAAMGMSAGAIYRYVEGKEALFDISVHYAAHLPINEKHIPVKVGSIDDTWGRSESLDPENVGDIADEGAGHRG